MLELREWIQALHHDDRPWLMLGKGPTFSRRSEFDLSQYRLLSLNHAVRELCVEVAHIIDIDVVEECADRLLDNCHWLIMPRVPHIHQRVGQARLEDYRDAIPVLRELDSRGRLVWYNAQTGPRVGDSPVIGVRYFSSEAALSLLGETGARVVRSLGIDGGPGCSAAFSSFSSGSRFNPRPYDEQFAEMERIADRYDLDLAPLIEPLRIYIGASRRDLLGVRVLDYSIRKHASVPVRVLPMIDRPVPCPRDPRNRPRTGFSFSRFLIPELARRRGRAVYLDSDMLVFGDVAELAVIPLAPHKVLCTYQDTPPAVWANDPSFQTGRHTAVMVLDCGRLDWDVQHIVRELDAGRLTYEELMRDMCLEDQDFGVLPQAWNHLEHFEPGVTKLLHYTNVPTQPWISSRNPLAPVWVETFREAVEAGAISPDEVRQLVSEGHGRRELLDLIPANSARPVRNRSAADVALAAAFAEIDKLRRNTQEKRLGWAAQPLRPLLRTARALRHWSERRPRVERLGRRVRRLVRSTS